LFSFVIP